MSWTSRNTAPLRFETERGFNVVEMRDEQVRVAEADCPDLLCVNTGWRRHVGQVIVCLPHYFVVRITEMTLWTSWTALRIKLSEVI